MNALGQHERCGYVNVFWTRIPTRRDRWLYRFRCLTCWPYMRQTRLFYHPASWWLNR